MSKDKKPKPDLKKAKNFLVYLKPYSTWYFIGFIFLVLTSITSIALPVLLGKLLGTNYSSSLPVDINVSSTDNIYTILMMLAIVLPAQAIFSFFRVYTFSYVTQNTLRDLRLAAFKHLVSSPMSFFDKNKVGELTSRIASDTQQIEETLATTLAEFFRQIIVIAASLGLIFYFSPRLSLIMLAIIPVVAVSAMIFGKFIKKLSRKAQDEAAQSNSVLEESLTGIKNLKAYTNEFFEIKNYTVSINNIRDTSMKSALWRGIFIAFILTIMLGAIVFIIWQGIELVQSGNITKAEFFQFIFLTVMLGTSIGSFPDLYAKIQKTLGATESLMKMMEEPVEPVSTNIPVKPDFAIKGDIELKNVSFYYESRQSVTVLNQINLKVNSG
ncbi:MAG: ABC transporter transmembrane domain-containing protein, partial [Bacteroidetes bacterium]|nr:ABC transporter transmembrane domain-containing protein [Bacteroidota bacterium]